MATTSGKSSRVLIIVAALIVAIAAIVVAVILVTRDSSAPGTVGEAEDPEVGTTQEQVGPASDEGEADVVEESTPSETPATPEADLTILETREEGDPLAVGPVDAPVGMVIFSDYQCGYCARWDAETLPILLEYVDREDLRIEWHHTVFFGAGSEAAAKAAYAAGLQGKYLEYNDALFAGGQPLAADALTSANLTALAGQLGLNETQFAADLNSAETAAAVAQDSAFAQQVGVTSTPTFVVAGTPVVGAQPADVFVELIDGALAN